MKNKKTFLILLLAQGIAYLTNGQTNRQFSGSQISVANQTKVFADDCKEQYGVLKNSYDTLAVGFDSCISANEDLEQAVVLLKEDLEMSKVVAQSLEAEKSATEKALKKEVRKKRLNGALVWVVSGVSAALMVLYVLK